MSSTATARRLFMLRPSPEMFRDLVVAAGAFAGSIAVLWVGGMAPHRPGLTELDPLGICLAASSTLPLAVWARFPLAVFALTAGAGVLLAGLGYPVDLLLGPAVALYLLAASREPSRPWTVRTTATVVALLIAYLTAAALAHATFPGTELLHTGLAWAAAWFAGERTRLRREQIGALRDRALRAEREVERERLLAAAEERARIARDLHDSAGHAINVIAVRAGAARLRHAREPDRSLGALEAIEEVARQTAADIDQIVGRLREGQHSSGVVDAPSGLASLDTLIAHHQESGLDVAVKTSGVQRQLGAAADQAAYRILQEALTNAARHGDGNARVVLTFGEAELGLTITNRLKGDGQPATVGHGLIGMTERATLLGGTLSAAPLDGTFIVRARIPYGSLP